MHKVHKRITVVLVLFIWILAALAGRFFYFQVIKGPEIAREAVSMRSRSFFLAESQRGDILDRFCRPLTGQGSAWAALLTLSQAGDLQETSRQLAESLSRNSKEVLANLKRSQANKDPFYLVQISFNHQELAQKYSHISGMTILPIRLRYQDNGYLIHLLGHISYMENGSCKGDAGIEARYDQYLQYSAPGSRVNLIVDAIGNPIPGLYPRLADEIRSGSKHSVVTTIDSRIQEAVEDVINRRMVKGAVVVLDVDNRDIVVLASRPTYNPYHMEEYINDEDNALLNRAFQAFHPGSLFKIVVVTAAMEKGLVTEEEKFYCPGEYLFSDNLAIPCWNTAGHGSIGLEEALAKSCNTALIEVALRVGRSALLSKCDDLALTRSDIIGYPNANRGSMVEIDYGEPALGNACLGQKGIMLTPLQVANLMATVADNGRYKEPRLIKEIRDEGRIIRYFKPDKGRQAIDPEVCKRLKEFLRSVTSEGTGKMAQFEGAECAGKTATSQTGQFDEHGEELLDTWFVGFFPVENPRWVISVLVEEGHSGGHDAAPIFREIAQQITQMYGAGSLSLNQ